MRSASSPLREAVRRALADRLLELGGLASTETEQGEVRPMQALADELGQSERTTRRWLREGPPPSWSEERLVRMAERLYFTSRRREDRPPEVQKELERRRALPVYSHRAREIAAEQLGRALGRLEGRRPCERGTWSPRLSLAQEFGVRSKRLGRWVEAGRVPAEYMPAVSAWAQEQAERELRLIAERGLVEGLIHDARRPGVTHQLKGGERKRAPRVPNVKSGERVVDNDHGEVGYSWTLRVEDWTTFERIQSWAQWAGDRRRPRDHRSDAGAAHNWAVTAMCAIYAPKGRATGLSRTASGKIVKRYEGMFRQFAGTKANKIGADLELNVPVSSQRIHRGGLARAVHLFSQAITFEHCQHDQVYVHYIIVRNWRVRTDKQRQAHYLTWQAKQENLARLAERAREKKKARQREAARKKSLGKRSRRSPRRS